MRVLNTILTMLLVFGLHAGAIGQSKHAATEGKPEAEVATALTESLSAAKIRIELGRLKKVPPVDKERVEKLEQKLAFYMAELKKRDFVEVREAMQSITAETSKELDKQDQLTEKLRKQFPASKEGLLTQEEFNQGLERVNLLVKALSILGELQPSREDYIKKMSGK